MRILRLNEESRYNDKSLREAIKIFIEANRDEIDDLASQENWESIYAILAESFEAEDQEEVRTIFNQEYGGAIEENEEEEDEEMDHRNTSRIKGMAFAGRNKSAMGINQKLTESSIKRLSEF